MDSNTRFNRFYQGLGGNICKIGKIRAIEMSQAEV